MTRSFVKPVCSDLICWKYTSLAERKAVHTTNAIERRFREIRRRTRPIGVFPDGTSMDRILFAVSTIKTKTGSTGSPRRFLGIEQVAEALANRTAEAIEAEIDDRRREQGQRLAQDQPADDRDPERMAQLRPGAGAEHQR